MRGELHVAAPPRRRAGEIAARYRIVPQGLRTAARRLLQARALPVLPALEVRGTGDEKSLEQRTAIEVECLFRPACRHGAVKFGDIAVHRLEIEPDLFVPARDHHVGAEGAPEHMECLAQSAAGVLLVEVRPEQREQRVTPVEAPRQGRGQIGEQREASGPREQALDFASLGVGEVQSPEQPELDHARPLRRWRSRARHRDGDGPVTSW